MLRKLGARILLSRKEERHREARQLVDDGPLEIDTRNRGRGDVDSNELDASVKHTLRYMEMTGEIGRTWGADYSSDRPDKGVARYQLI